MSGKIAAVQEAFTALGTLKRPLSRVTLHVDVEGNPTREGLAAFLTLERPLFRMGDHVSLQRV